MNRFVVAAKGPRALWAGEINYDKVNIDIGINRDRGRPLFFFSKTPTSCFPPFISRTLAFCIELFVVLPSSSIAKPGPGLVDNTHDTLTPEVLPWLSTLLKNALHRKRLYHVICAGQTTPQIIFTRNLLTSYMSSRTMAVTSLCVSPLLCDA